MTSYNKTSLNMNLNMNKDMQMNVKIDVCEWISSMHDELGYEIWFEND
jgi:hypothetical protein